jgi:hypothetical protein
MTSFKVAKDGSIKVKPSVNALGVIQYYFKGKKTNIYKARIISVSNESHILVKNENTHEKYSFILKDGLWLMEIHSSPKSLLHGTQFISNEISENF